MIKGLHGKKEIDSLSCAVTIENGKYKVSAILYFNEKGELINFVSDDRSALQDDGTMKKARWSTPVSDYKEIDGGREFLHMEKQSGILPKAILLMALSH